MSANENKENDVAIATEDGISPPFPQTPAHLLKRTHSTVLKSLAPAGAEIPDLANQGGNKHGKNESPLRKLCVQQGRPPLASKDNNRSNSFIFQQQQQQQQQQQSSSLALKGNSTLFKKQKQPSLRYNYRAEHGQLLANPKKLKKYGSVLGYNALPKIKSLVLKDIDSGSKQEEHDEEDDDDDDDDSGLSSKLQNAISRPNRKNEGGEEDSEIGGLFSKDGLQQLVREAKKDEDKDDRSIEYGPIQQDPLPYVPNGYTSLTADDINKLKTFHSPHSVQHLNNIDSEEENPHGLLELEDFRSSDDDENEINDGTKYSGSAAKKGKGQLIGNLLDIELSYRGDGISANELNDLLKD